MSDTLRIQIEIGPKGKKQVAVAPDWPGLSRGGKTEEAAIETLLAYLPRYAPIAEAAGFGDTFGQITDVGEIVRYPGVGSTDFWGISFAFSEFDHSPMSDADLERNLTILQSCWAWFDAVGERVSPDLRLGPRGGGRNREQVIRHTLFAEQEMRRKIGFPKPERTLAEPAERDAGRAEYLAAIRTYHAEGRMAKNWPLRYLIRHTAFHSLDHGWEMEDRDLTNA